MCFLRTSSHRGALLAVLLMTAATVAAQFAAVPEPRPQLAPIQPALAALSEPRYPNPPFADAPAQPELEPPAVSGYPDPPHVPRHVKSWRDIEPMPPPPGQSHHPWMGIGGWGAQMIEPRVPEYPQWSATAIAAAEPGPPVRPEMAAVALAQPIQPAPDAGLIGPDGTATLAAHTEPSPHPIPAVLAVVPMNEPITPVPPWLLKIPAAEPSTADPAAANVRDAGGRGRSMPDPGVRVFGPCRAACGIQQPCYGRGVATPACGEYVGLAFNRTRGHQTTRLLCRGLGGVPE